MIRGIWQSYWLVMDEKHILSQLTVSTSLEADHGMVEEQSEIHDDESLPCADLKPASNAAPSPEDKVVSYIESQLSSILCQLCSQDGTPSITINRRSSRQSGCVLNQDTGALESTSTVRVVPHTYSWPGKTAQETWRFATILRILGHIHEAIKGDFTSTKRDLYYLDPVHFGKQAVVDRYVDDIAFTIGVDRAALHVVCSIFL